MDSSQYAFTSAHKGKFCIPPQLQHKGGPMIMKLGNPATCRSRHWVRDKIIVGKPTGNPLSRDLSRF